MLFSTHSDRREAPLVVFAATEAVPLAKAGGLADVTSALAAALARTGCDVALVLPAYGFIDRAAQRLRPVPGFQTQVHVGGRQEPVRLLEGVLEGTTVRLVLIEHDGYFGRDGIYSDPATGDEYEDAVERWVYLSRAVLAALPALGRAPDILHLNDYHVALCAPYRNVENGAGRDPLLGTGIVMGLHNLGYQGSYPAERFDVTGLPHDYIASMGALEFWGRMNFLKAGLVHADLLTTVSPTYAREIQNGAEHGCGLHSVLRQRCDDLVGILNGIDAQVWDPARDPLIPARYDATSLQGKQECKHALQRRSGLRTEPDVPLFGMISRLVDQKGVDVLLQALPEMLRMRLQVVLLGRGLPEYERRLSAFAREHPGRVSVQLGFDDVLAHWIEAGSDFFMMPSRYEPCGLNQMYSMRYATVPVVRRTGGLADTVVDWSAATSRGTGFVFEAYDAEAFLESIRRACGVYEQPQALRTLRQTGMRQDFSWERSARLYLELYERAGARRAPWVAAREPGRLQPGFGPGRGH